MDDQTLQNIRKAVKGGRSVDAWAVATLLADRDRLRDGITRHRDVMMSQLSSPWNVGHEGKPITTPSRDDRDLWALIGDDDE